MKSVSKKIRPLNLEGQQWALIILIPFIALIFSKGMFIQLQSVTIFLACCLIITKGIKVKTIYFSNLLFFLFFYGTILGLVYTILGDNSFYKCIQYSFLSFSAYIGFRSAFVYLSKFSIVHIVIFFIAADVLMFFALRFGGHFGRTSIGTTNLYPALLFLAFNSKIFNKFSIKIGLFILLFFCIIAYLTSGMRSSIGVMIFSSIIIVLYAFKIKNVGKILRISVLGGVLLLLMNVFVPSNFFDNVIKQLDNVAYRFQTTLLNDEGFRLDSKKGEGRDLEAQSALAKINKNTGVHQILGYGNGFVYFDQMQSRIKAHLHLTYVAYYVRYGILGLFVLASLYLLVIFKSIKSFFRKKSFENGLSLALWISAIQICVISSVAASLISILHWIIIGMAFAYDKYLENKKYTNEWQRL
ncbi:hypothetical protein [Dokdonia sp. LLG6352-1]|uniref:hypothetical protein n=1 Tax=Dokdonia sp. LLG6352-1 TaxID=3160831 RepID=UPI003869B91B